MSKQSIVKEAKVLEKDGGKKSYVVTFEDGVNGFYEIKECGELKQGDHVEYTVEEKTSKAGKKYNTITVTKTTGESKPTPPPQPSKPQSSPAPIRDAVIAGKIETSQDEFKSWYNALTAQVDASIDEIR